MSELIRRLFRWRKVPPAPLTSVELLKIEIAFGTCEGNCPIAIVFKAMMDHIKWQEKHLKEAKEDYDK